MDTIAAGVVLTTIEILALCSYKVMTVTWATFGKKLPTSKDLKALRTQ